MPTKYNKKNLKPGDVVYLEDNPDNNQFPAVISKMTYNEQYSWIYTDTKNSLMQYNNIFTWEPRQPITTLKVLTSRLELII